MQARNQARRTSSRLFKDLVRRSENQVFSSVATVHRESPERPLWLEQYLEQVRGGKVNTSRHQITRSSLTELQTYIDSNATHELRRRGVTQQATRGLASRTQVQTEKMAQSSRIGPEVQGFSACTRERTRCGRRNESTRAPLVPNRVPT